MLESKESINDNVNSVGQEFIEWAEQYWHIDKNFEDNNPDIFNGEKCDYKYMREIFIEKINCIIKDRLSV